MSTITARKSTVVRSIAMTTTEQAADEQAAAEQAALAETSARQSAIWDASARRSPANDLTDAPDTEPVASQALSRGTKRSRSDMEVHLEMDRRNDARVETAIRMQKALSEAEHERAKVNTFTFIALDAETAENFYQSDVAAGDRGCLKYYLQRGAIERVLRRVSKASHERQENRRRFAAMNNTRSEVWVFGEQRMAPFPPKKKTRLAAAAGLC